MKRANVHVEPNKKGMQDLGQEVTEKMIENGELTYLCPECGTEIVLKPSIATCPKCGFKLGTKIEDTVVTD